MKNPTSFLILWLMLLVQHSYGQNAQQFTWMLGIWQSDSKNGTIEEQWKIINTTTIKGTSRLIRPNEGSLLNEEMEIVYIEGSWIFKSTVVGQNNDEPVVFPIIFLTDEEFIAQNMEHDYPQRISYRRIETGLYASIEGTQDGVFSKRNFDFFLP